MPVQAECETLPRPFPSLERGTLRSLEQPAVNGRRMNQVLYSLENLWSQMTRLAARVTRRLPGAGSGKKKPWISLGTEILVVTSVLHAASGAAAASYHIRSLFKKDASGADTSYLLRQTETVMVHITTWTKITKPSPFLSVFLSLLQAVTFVTFLGTFMFLPTLGHLLKEFLANKLLQRYTTALNCLPSFPTWQQAEVPAHASSFWSLQKQANVGHLFEAMRDDVSYISHVNSSVARPGTTRDLIGSFPPESSTPKISSMSQGGSVTTSSMNPLFTEPPTSLEQTPMQNRTRSSRPPSSNGGTPSPRPSPSEGLVSSDRNSTQRQTPVSRSNSLTENFKRAFRRGALPLGGDGDLRISRRQPDDDDDAASAAGSSNSHPSRSTVREPAEVMDVMDKMWGHK